MLNGIHLVDFGNHRDTRLTFGRITALVGQNGAGKTNVMRAVMELSRLCNDEVEVNRIIFDSDKSFTRKSSLEYSLSASWPSVIIQEKSDWGMILDTSSNRAQWLWRSRMERDCMTWLPDPNEDLINTPIGIRKEFSFSLIDKPKPRESEFRILNDIPAGEIVRSEIAPYIRWKGKYFKTAGNYLKQPSYSEVIPPILSEDCHELAWVISYMKGDDDELFDSLTNSLREVVPVLKRVRNRPVPIERTEKRSIVLNKKEHFFDEEKQIMGRELLFDMASGKDLPASSISEGTLITLAILTAIMHDDGGAQTILLDDIESGLHPKAQRDLVRQLKRLQETRPELQIIFSSHSPYIIDEMEPEDVWLFAADKEGCAHAAKLSDHPDAKRALEVLTTGEFWSAEGEEWVLDPKKRRQPEPEDAASTPAQS